MATGRRTRHIKLIYPDRPGSVSLNAVGDAPTTKKAGTDAKHRLGIIFIIAATVIFACQDAITKRLVTDYPITFIVMVRYWAFFSIGLVAANMADGGLRASIRSNRRLVHLIRGILLVVEIAIVGLAYKTMGLAETMALFQAYPLFVTALAAIFLGERVGCRRWLALAAGFAGILIILRPGTGIIEVGAIYTLAGALIYALYQTLTRLSGTGDSAVTSFLYVGAVGAFIMTLGLPFFWVDMAAVDMIWLLALCAMGIAGHFCLIKALELAPATLLQPFNYLQLVWAVIIGWIVFREMPDVWTFLGGAIVVGSGLFVFYRERQRAPKPIQIR